MNIYQNPSYTPEERVSDLLPRMTIEEKIGQMCQVDGGKVDAAEWITKRHVGSILHVLGDVTNELQTLAEVSRLGIPILFAIDAIHGNAFHPDAVVFPTQLALACSWNPLLVEKVGRVTAKETRVTGAAWTFSPVCDVARDLRWGRVDEGFGEDPFLVGELVKALVKGYQGDDLAQSDAILACAKHFAGYSEGQGGRDAVEADLSERKLRRLHFRAFQQAVQAGCATVMAGYHAVDGVPCSANHWLLTEVLRHEWGFGGVVVTDYDNVGQLHKLQGISPDMQHASQLAIQAGNDMMMQTVPFYDAALALANQGALDMALVDEAVRRILSLKFQLGLFDEQRYAPLETAPTVLGSAAHRQLALEAAHEAVVLLKNTDDLLPLGEDVRRIALIGQNADDVRNQLGDWVSWAQRGSVNGETRPRQNTTTILDGLRKRFSGEVLHHVGYQFTNHSEQLLEEAVAIAKQSEVIIAVVGDDLPQYGEFHDRADLALDPAQQTLIAELKALGKPLIVVLLGSKPLAVGAVVDQADAFLVAWNPGNLGGQALADIIFGDVAPSGKLPISFPYHVGQQPVYYDQMPGWHGGKYIDQPADSLFAFGQGLTYTEFAYHDLQVLRPTLTPDETLKVQVTLQNKGSRKGTEIAQLYIHDLFSTVTTPIKVLKAFQRITLEGGDTTTLHFEVPYDELALIDQNGQALVEAGDFEVMVGGSSRENDLLKATFSVQA